MPSVLCPGRGHGTGKSDEGFSSMIVGKMEQDSTSSSLSPSSKAQRPPWRLRESVLQYLMRSFPMKFKSRFSLMSLLIHEISWFQIMRRLRLCRKKMQEGRFNLLMIRLNA